MLFDIVIFTVCPVYNCREYTFLRIYKVEFRIFYIKFSSKRFDDRVDKVGVSVRIFILGSIKKGRFYEVLQIFAQNIYGISFGYGLLSYIETPCVYLVKFLLKEAVYDLFVYSSC